MRKKRWKKNLFLIVMTAFLISGCGTSEKDAKQTENSETLQEEADQELQTDVQDEGKAQGDLRETGTEEETEQETEFAQTDEAEKTEYQIVTEYDLEDYADGYIIVSKNDGLLYGVIDVQGREVIPVEYDNIKFVSGYQGKERIQGGIYFCCEYEGQEEILDSNGQKILDGSVEFVKPYLGESTDTTPLFYCRYTETYSFYNNTNFTLEGDEEIRYYSKNGAMLCAINAYEGMAAIDTSQYYKGTFCVNDAILLSNDRILVSLGGLLGDRNDIENTKVYYDVLLYNLNGELLQEWDRLATSDYLVTRNGNECVFALIDYWADENPYRLYSIDENGNLTDLGDLDSQDEYVIDKNGRLKSNEEYLESIRNSGVSVLGKNKEYRLYKSNDTWKFENDIGEAVYDKRYYDCWHIEECYFLMNEDNELCLINQNGQMLVDYGRLTFDGEDGVFQGNIIDDDNFRSDGESACFEVEENGEKVMYVFYPESKEEGV